MFNTDNVALQQAEQQLLESEAAARRILLRHIAAGVEISSSNIVIDDTVVIAPGAKILPGTPARQHRYWCRLCHRPQHPD